MRGRNRTWHRYYSRHHHDPVRAGGQDRRRRPERNIRADALDESVFGQIRAALLDPALLPAGEQAITVHAPAPGDQLLAAGLARLVPRLSAAQWQLTMLRRCGCRPWSGLVSLRRHAGGAGDVPGMREGR
jgi:hypothetical protein